MKQQHIFVPLLRIIGYISLFVLMIIMIGLFSVNYVNGIAVITGILIYVLLAWLLRSRYGSTALIIIITIVVGFLIPLFGQWLSYIPPCAISYHRIVAIPQTLQLNGIIIREFVILDENVNFTPPTSWNATYVNGEMGFGLPEIEATIDNRGFLIKEASIQSSVPCSGKVDVKLEDFPLNSFYAAHYAENLEKFPYVDTETITWSSESRNIRFSYIKPPLQAVRPILSPLVGASSLNQWLMGIIAIIGTVIITPIIKPVLTEIAQKSIKNRITNPEVLTKQTAKLITSEKGDVKDIEITKKH